MSYNKSQLEMHIIDCALNADPLWHLRFSLQALATDRDGIVYLPDGLIKTMQPIVSVSQPQMYRLFEKLKSRNFYHPIDKNSLQLNPQFSNYGVNPRPYIGSPIIYTHDELKIIHDLDLIRHESWKARGKDTKKLKHAKKDDLMKAMQKKLDHLEDQNDKLIGQNTALISQNNELLNLLREIASGLNSEAAKEKAQCHLTLLQGGLHEQSN